MKGIGRRSIGERLHVISNLFRVVGRRGAHAQYGWISLLYLREDYRGRGFGIQLLARPLRDYADMQRNALRLLVSSDNERALKFYKRCGFRQLSTQPGAAGELLLMERKLGGSRDARV